MATITITSSSFGGIGAVVQGDVPATLTIDIGIPGPGVPAGGTTGQVLKKASATDYDTTWGTDLASAAWGTITGTITDQTDLTAYVAAQLAGGTAVAKMLEVEVRNQTGATLTAGTIVYINGATGNKPTVTKAIATGDSTSAQTLGFIKADIANNGTGKVVVRGLLENIDTSALTEGQQLYLSGTTAGTWQTTKPVAPIHLVYVGIVTRAHPTLGTIEVAIQNGYELDELHDVKITSVSNGQVLKYDSAQGLWVNGTDSSGVAWGGITGTLSAQTDLQTALDAKATAADFLSKAGNLSGLADLATSRSNLGLGTMATATASDYSTTTVANGLYYPLSSNPAGYLTSASLTGYATESWVTTELGSYLTTASASSTYLTQANAATTYYPLTGNPSGFLTSAPVTSVAGKTGAVTLTNSDISGLGTMATATATDYLAKAGNLSGLADLATSRSNLGLGTMATETASNYLTTSAASSTYLTQANAASTYQTQAGMSSYLTTSAAASTYQTISGMSSYLTTSAASSTYAPLASPALTGTPTAPTAAVDTNTTQVATTAYVIGQGYLKSATASSTYAPLASPALTGTPTAPTASAGTNTTQIATTAFVQTAAPDASTTAAGKVELATIDEAQAGNSTTLVPTVEGVTWMMMNEANRPYFNLTGGSSGTGASINLVPPFRYEFMGPNASVAGFAYGQTNNYSGMTDGYGSSIFNFDQKCWISFGLDNVSGTWVGDANNEIKVFWGLNTSNNGDDPNGKAIGVWKQGGSSSYWNLMVHDGTTLTKVASTTTMPTGQLQRFTVYSDGAGNVKLYINGTEVASTSSGPTGTRADTRFWASVKQTASATTRIMNMIYYPKVYAQP